MKTHSSFLYWMCVINAYIYIAPSVSPAGFTSTTTTATSIVFQWAALTNDKANGIVRQYVISCDGLNSVSCNCKFVLCKLSQQCNKNFLSIVVKSSKPELCLLSWHDFVTSFRVKDYPNNFDCDQI